MEAMEQELKKFVEEYIDFFEQTPAKELYQGDGIECQGDAVSIGGPSYHPKVYAFERACYDLNLMEGNYMSLLEATGKDRESWVNHIETMDLVTLKAFLTFCIRGERFCSGWMKAFLEDKVFARILRRMRDLQRRETRGRGCCLL